MRRKAEGKEKGSLPAAEEGRKRIHGARSPGVGLKKKEKQTLDGTKLPFVYQNSLLGGGGRGRFMLFTQLLLGGVAPEGFVPICSRPSSSPFR